MSNVTEGQDPKCEHQLSPPQPVQLADLVKLGASYYMLDPDSAEDQKKLEDIKKERGFVYGDDITITKESLGDKYDATIKSFFTEHLHGADEIRYIRDGSGYFDVRDRGDKWVRIHVTKGDLLILPAGLYHRFYLDSKEYIRASRFFINVPVWTPFNRPAEDHPSRVAYVNKMKC
ncbi:PREDICTED: 1,2-dihydroxy-3-keto-5-methylthiopentene dioxygenase-like [Priapulus caudatus]|uniref:Acireductone dioxygenase n=1 Tax=Priapulus caudatus TaxID=37621 RepID=A0ABM1DUP9_PRICU|nr:PREDICTED: 1,2-dihydroxy-3-keto-5-methylthiopentene dioxygenase-like [Priapulus caudatus]